MECSAGLVLDRLRCWLGREGRRCCFASTVRSVPSLDTEKVFDYSQSPMRMVLPLRGHALRLVLAYLNFRVSHLLVVGSVSSRFVLPVLGVALASALCKEPSREGGVTDAVVLSEVVVSSVCLWSSILIVVADQACLGHSAVLRCVHVACLLVESSIVAFLRLGAARVFRVALAREEEVDRFLSRWARSKEVLL